MSTEQNIANYRRFIEEAWNKGNVAVINELAAPGLVLRFMPPGTPPGAESIQRHITMMRAAFPDVTITIEDQVAEGNKVVTRWTMAGTHRGPYLNHLKVVMPPTGRKFSAGGIDIWRYDANGKWVECWSSFDRLGMLQQLGALPAAGPNASQVVPAANTLP